MAMSLQIPSSPSDGASSTSTHPPSPLTPPSISQSLSDVNADSNSSTIPHPPAGKRKPSRRANTAERRATHNAVERQRRETLNGRFLDLAALLPNLSQIRRPSKSSIVNSSIAHIHASRRHRLLASREFRALKAEVDELRRELNEWRGRSGLPRAVEPTRSDAFNMVLSGEVEVVVPVIQHEDDQNMDDDEDDFQPRSPEDVEEVARVTAINMIKRSQSPISVPSPANHQFAHNISSLPAHQNGVVHAHSQQVMGGPQTHRGAPQLAHGRQLSHTAPHNIHSGGPMIATHQSPVSYENPAMIYEGYNQSQFGYNAPQPYANGQLPPHVMAQLANETEQKAGPGWYTNQTGQLTPPNSSGGSPVNSPFGGMGGGLSGGYPITQQPRYIENGFMGRERSASIGSRGSPVGNYELVGGAHMDNMPRWRDDRLVGAPVPNPAAYSLMM